MDLKKLLKEKYGYDNFRYGQEKIINSILDNRDTLGIMPTGAGKSICFQLPALVMPGITLVITPLISLMKDQVESLNQNGINAAFMNSANTRGHNRLVIRDAKKGKHKIIYITPERFKNEDFNEFINSVDISMVAVDEAHCVSQWGQDFRPSYLEIYPFIKQLNKRPIISAFTATATKKVTEDIVNFLKLDNPYILTTGFNRNNLYFEVKRIKDKLKLGELLKFLDNNKDKNGIIYCGTRKTVDDLCEVLEEQGYRVKGYHAGMPEVLRNRNQNEFIYGDSNIMVATNAFGMGIDKSDVNYVIHYNMPKNIENYYQEAGRAGRDGQDAKCILYYSEADVQLNRFFIENMDNDLLSSDEQKLFIKQEYRNLNLMVGYCTTNDCLKKYILNYFGEEIEPCGNCGNCNTDFDKIDFTIGA